LPGTVFRQTTGQDDVPRRAVAGRKRALGTRALSAALAAREFGLKSLAVPEANAKEAAVVEGVDVYALKSLPQAVDLVNSPESFTPVKVNAQQMLSEAAQYSVDLRDVYGQQPPSGR